MKKKLVYISHPSSGKIENTKHIEYIVRELLKSDALYSKYCFVSPVHCYGFMYDEYEENYLKGLSFCTDLLEHCDIMLLCGEWETSRGCSVEQKVCIEKHIPMLEVRTDDDLAKLIEAGDIEKLLVE